jgi:hypothetical protein
VLSLVPRSAEVIAADTGHGAGQPRFDRFMP